MCLSIPHKIISISGIKAKVECGDDPHELDIRLVPDAKVGDYVINESDFAIQKISKKDAKETLNIIKNANTTSN